MHVDEARGYGKGSEMYQPWNYQGKGPGPWGYSNWKHPADQNYELPGYAFKGNQSLSDDWGGTQ